MRKTRFKLRPIGHVEKGISHDTSRHRLAVSKIIIDRKFVRGLKGLEGFSHFYVLFLLHEAPTWGGNLMTRPRGRTDIEKVGVFATRSPHRPNPIGLTLVKLLSKRGRILTVKGLDAYDGTPILDLKPYDRRDSTPRPRVPAWWKKLERGSNRGRSLLDKRASRMGSSRGKARF